MGYVPGEGIPFTATVINKSGTKLTEPTITLRVFVKPKAQDREKQFNDQDDVAQIIRPNDFEGEREEWSGVLVVPPCMCSMPPGMCRLTEVEYKLIFSFRTSMFALANCAELPLVIGFVPLPDVRVTTPFVYLHSETDHKPTGLFVGREPYARMEAGGFDFRPLYPFYPGLVPPSDPSRLFTK